MFFWSVYKTIQFNSINEEDNHIKLCEVWCVSSEPYIGVEQIDAVQALAAVNAAFDAA